jgi:Clp amino terminal domain, pathogenicity island component
VTSGNQLPGGYTDRAAAALAAAQAQARELGHDRVHPGHLLLGVIDAGDGVAVRVLAALGVAVAALGPRIEELLGQGGPVAGPAPPLSPLARRALDLAREEAAGQPRIGTEHLLLGTLGAGGAVADLLAGLGATPPRVRAEAQRLVAGYAQGWPLTAGESAGDELVELRFAVLRMRVREFNEKLAELRWGRHAAIRGGDLDRAAALRHAEQQVLEEKAVAVAGWARELDMGFVLDELDRLYHEVDRLRALLHQHGVPPD